MLRTILVALLLSTPAVAHDSAVGPNGGMRVDAGQYRVELVPAGTKVDVYITLDDDSQVDTTAMSGMAILLIDGKPVRATLAPTSLGILSGDAGTAVPNSVKGAVQLKGADGKTVQAKF